MDVAIQSLWIILTVMVPGLVFYGCIWFLGKYLNVSELIALPQSLAGSFTQSETIVLCGLFAVMFLLQLFGIATELFFFNNGFYRHKDPYRQDAFDKKYIIISKMDPEKDYHVERILCQFFMSHNIAVGLSINLIWVSIYLFAINVSGVTFNEKILFLVLLIMVMLSWYVSHRRFLLSCDVLYSHSQEKKKSAGFFAREYGDSDSSARSKNKSENESVSFSLIVLSFAFIIGGIGYCFDYHLGEGFLIGLAIGFIIVSILRDKNETYLFRWDEITGNDRSRFKEVLKKKFDIGLVEPISVEEDKTHNNIKISDIEKSISLELDEKNAEVIMGIDGNRTRLITKKENDRIYVYEYRVYKKRAMSFRTAKYFLLIIIMVVGIAYAFLEDSLRNAGSFEMVYTNIISVVLFLLGLVFAAMAVISNKKDKSPLSAEKEAA